MKNLILLCIILANAASLTAQYEVEFAGGFHKNGRKPCDARVELADSSINNQLNPVEGTYLPVSVIQYFYNEDLDVNLVIKKTLPERTNVYRQIFEYDADQNITRYIYQLWLNNEWQDNLITERTYTPEGLMDTEVFIRENAQGVFESYQRHFYVQEDGRITRYIRQVKDASGNWYDFSEHLYVYDPLGHLTVLYGRYYNTDLIYWERTSVYGDDGYISERFLRLLKYNPEKRRNILTNSTLQKYHYNIYGSADTVYNYNWENQKWQYAGKDVGYFSLIKGKKVRICHNGTNLCVSSNAVQTHLEHGDKLGECDINDSMFTEYGRFPDPERQETKCFSLYPNPAENHITIKIESESKNYKQAIILSSDGKVMSVYNINEDREKRCNISMFRSGIYFVRLIKTEGFDTQAFIKN